MSLSTLYPTTRPSLLLDFVNRRRLDSRVTFTRASSATYFDQLGVLQSASNDVPRFDFDPSTLQPRGLLIEEQRTNSIRNNTMQGAVAGTPGTVPTNWFAFTALTGLTSQVVGTGTDNGVTYIDFRLSGTPSAAGTYLFGPEQSTQVAASNGQTWTASTYVKLASGSLTGVSFELVITERSTSAELARSSQSFTPTSAALNSQRIAVTRTNNNASTAFELPFVQFNLTGAAIDITLRIGLPQLEQGAFATSVIPTTTAAATRSADVASMTGANFSSWFNASEGTFSVRYSSVSAPNLRSFAASDGTSNNTIEGVAASSAGTGVLFSIRESNTVQANVPASITPVTDQVYNVAGAYASNNAAGSRDGNIATDSVVNIPTVDRLYIGASGSAASQLNGHIRRITYYPRRLTNAQLQALTAS